MKCFQTAAACISLLLTVSALHAQVTGFKLSDYKYRTPVYRSLQLDLDLNQQSSALNDKSIDSRKSGLGMGLHSNLAYIESYATNKREHISQYGFNQQTLLSGQKEQGVRNVNNAVSFGGHYGVDDRWYRDGFFFETGGGVGVRTRSTKVGLDTRNSRDRESSVNLGLNAGIGKGRLEYVHDAQTALFILEDLFRAGLIRSKVDNETAYRFAEHITQIKKHRVLDARRRTIYQLNQVDSFLRVNKILAHCDAKAMAIINDNFFYGFQNDLSGNLNKLGSQPDFSFTGDYDEGFEDVDFGLIPQIEPYTDQSFRRHGSILYARLQPTLYYNKQAKHYRDGTKDSVWKQHYMVVEPALLLGFEKRVAVDLHWQKDYSASAGISKSAGSGSFDLAGDLLIDLNTRYGIGYYPNNRTVVEARGDIHVGYWKYDQHKTFLFAPGLHLTTGYIVSYNTVLRASFNASFTRFSTQRTSDFTQNLRVYLTHYFL